MKNASRIKITLISVFLILITGGFIFAAKHLTNKPTPNLILAKNYVNNIIQTPTADPSLLKLPLSRALERVTKKPFGVYVTPKNSPVNPEKFTGYHTGVDFEILPGEENQDVLISAVCDGTLLLKKSATGYGGVAVESCNLNNQAVTIIYGHLKLSSISLTAGQEITSGDKIGLLGKGYSTETSGERKHLHLGIHRGADINLLGYVQNKSQLSGWLNALDYLK